MLFICFHHFLERGLKLIVPLGQQLCVSLLRLSDFSTNKRQSVWTVIARSDSREPIRLKRAPKGLVKPKTHLVNWVVSDIEHPLNKDSCVQGSRTCAQPFSPLSSHPPRLAQPTGISKKNSLARHDAALGSERQPTPAGSESGVDEGKGEENEREKKKREKGVSVAHLVTCGKKS